MELVRDFDSFYELIEYFDSEETCKDHLEKVRWSGNPVYTLQSRTCLHSERQRTRQALEVCGLQKAVQRHYWNDFPR